MSIVLPITLLCSPHAHTQKLPCVQQTTCTCLRHLFMTVLCVPHLPSFFHLLLGNEDLSMDHMVLGSVTDLEVDNTTQGEEAVTCVLCGPTWTEMHTILEMCMVTTAAQGSCPEWQVTVAVARSSRSSTLQTCGTTCKLTGGTYRKVGTHGLLQCSLS